MNERLGETLKCDADGVSYGYRVIVERHSPKKKLSFPLTPCRKTDQLALPFGENGQIVRGIGSGRQFEAESRRCLKRNVRFLHRHLWKSPMQKQSGHLPIPRLTERRRIAGQDSSTA